MTTRPPPLWNYRYFVSENVQVSVAVRLIPSSSPPTQGAVAGEITIASGPDSEAAAAASVPVPRTEQVGRSPIAPAATVKVADVSCAPETVPANVALTTASSPSSSSTTRTKGPETLAPLWVTVQDLI